MVKKEDIWSLLEQIPDPEIPVISIVELGVIRNIQITNNKIAISITPTYSGCPAMVQIQDDISQSLTSQGYNFKINLQLSPAWTTEWISNEAKKKLKKFGIAPPEKEITCPQCKSKNVEVISEFGSTACKALYRCLDCLEPFDYFKCI